MFLFQKSETIKPNPPDPPDKLKILNMKVIGAGILTRARKKHPTTMDATSGGKGAAAKKKTVTFKNILETSDDVNNVKKVYNPDKVPAVPIIKISKNREELSRSERFARGDIVMPSRLTEVLKNYSANHIDKLNLLTFKSVNSNPDQQHTHNLSSIEKSHVDFSFKNVGSDNSLAAATNEKKFILPKRSAHSCRVIKPNKRFLDETNDPLNKFNRKLHSSKKIGRSKSFDFTDDRLQKTENFINITLSSQINSSKLNEADYESETSQNMSDGNNSGMNFFIIISINIIIINKFE